jgi:hypothetical protein
MLFVSTHESVELQLFPFFKTSTLVGGEWSASRAGYFTEWKMSCCPLKRRLGGPSRRNGRLDKRMPAPLAEPRLLDCPSHNLVNISTENRPVLNLYRRMIK